MKTNTPSVSPSAPARNRLIHALDGGFLPMNPLLLAAQIEQNADAFWDDVVSYEAFHARAHQLWSIAESHGWVPEVSKYLRVNQP